MTAMVKLVCMRPRCECFTSGRWRLSYPMGTAKPYPATSREWPTPSTLCKSPLWVWPARIASNSRKWSKFVRKRDAGSVWSSLRRCEYRERLAPCSIQLRFFEWGRLRKCARASYGFFHVKRLQVGDVGDVGSGSVDLKWRIL